MTTNNSGFIEAQYLTVRRGGEEVLRDVSLSLGPGIFAVRGRNGAGKSTLLRALAGVVPIAGGSVRIGGFDLEREPVRAKSLLAFVPDSSDLFPYLSGREFLGLVASLRGCTSETSEELFAQLTDLAASRRPIATLSAGQKRKLVLAAATCGDPRVLLLDEPTNTLDAAAVDWLLREVRNWSDQGRTILLSTHGTGFDLPFAASLHVEAGTVRLVSARASR